MFPSDSSQEQLRKALEWELSLSTDDLRSHGWYHGSINRQKAEELLQQEGDFLVRDCQSRPGDFVLSVKGRQNQCLHFVINKVVCQPHTVYERIQFSFEDEPFDTVPDLVTYYVGNRRPVSMASGAIISRPVNRCVPLSLTNIESLQLDVPENSVPPPKPTRKKIESQEVQSETRPLFTLPSPHSCIQPQNFSTYLLPRDNKPLEQQTTIKIHSVLIGTGSRILANHLTKCNLEFIGHHKEEKTDLGLGVTSGLELMLLPQGEQMRLDLLDRFTCFKYFIILSILTCEEMDQITNVLSKWIQIAVECKTGLGDCFAFEVMMEALSHSSVAGLKQIWLLLRQKQTETAICYETKLKPMAKNLIENVAVEQAPNTTFPAITSLAKILLNDNNNITENFDLQQIHYHCENGRLITRQLDLYKRNAKTVLDSVNFEELLLDMFKTEFHRKFLWGSKGCEADGLLRVEKLNQVIEAMANKYKEIPEND